MDKAIAISILNEAKEGGFYAKEIPESDVEILEEARYFLKEARLALDDPKLSKNDTIQAIVSLGEAASNGSHKATKLPIPNELADATYDMPRDLPAVDELKIRRLYGEFNALFASATWALALEQANLTNATHLKNEAFRAAYNRLNRIDEETDKPKSIPTLELEAKEDPDYRHYENNANNHEIESIKMKALKEIYAGNIERLSREMTFRKEQWERNK